MWVTIYFSLFLFFTFDFFSKSSFLVEELSRSELRLLRQEASNFFAGQQQQPNGGYQDDVPDSMEQSDS